MVIININFFSTCYSFSGLTTLLLDVILLNYRISSGHADNGDNSIQFEHLAETSLELRFRSPMVDWPPNQTGKWWMRRRFAVAFSRIHEAEAATASTPPQFDCEETPIAWEQNSNLYIRIFSWQFCWRWKSGACWHGERISSATLSFTSDITLLLLSSVPSCYKRHSSFPEQITIFILRNSCIPQYKEHTSDHDCHQKPLWIMSYRFCNNKMKTQYGTPTFGI